MRLRWTRRTAGASLLLVLVGAVLVSGALAIVERGPASLSRQIVLSSGRAATGYDIATTFADQVAPGRAVSARFAEGIHLSGFDLTTPAMAGEFVVITLYWQAMAQPGANYKVFLHMLGRDREKVAQHDGAPVGGARPTGGWKAGDLVRDSHVIVVPANVAPGSYGVAVGLYDGVSGQRLKLLDDLPSSSADALLLPDRVQVLPPQPPPGVMSH